MTVISSLCRRSVVSLIFREVCGTAKQRARQLPAQQALSRRARADQVVLKQAVAGVAGGPQHLQALHLATRPL